MKVFIFFPRFFKEMLRLQNHTAQFCYLFPSAMIMNISNSRFSPQSAKKISKHTSAKRRSRRATWSSTVNCWTGCTSAYLRILCLSVAPWRTVVTSDNFFGDCHSPRSRDVPPLFSCTSVPLHRRLECCIVSFKLICIYYDPSFGWFPYKILTFARLVFGFIPDGPNQVYTGDERLCDVWYGYPV